jgi:hypothetical protein
MGEGKCIATAALALLCAACAAPATQLPGIGADEVAEAHTSPDEREVRMLAQERAKGAHGNGFLLIDAELKGTCDVVTIMIARKVGDSWQRIDVRGTSTRRLFGRTIFGTTGMAPAGDYVVQSVTCRSLGDTFVFSGPHARFQVRSGEFVDVGALQLSHKMDEGFFASTGTQRRAVVPTSPERLAHLKGQAPRLASIRVSRPMVLIGPAEVKTQRKYR